MLLPTPFKLMLAVQVVACGVLGWDRYRGAGCYKESNGNVLIRKSFIKLFDARRRDLKPGRADKWRVVDGFEGRRVDGQFKKKTKPWMTHIGSGCAWPVVGACEYYGHDDGMKTASVDRMALKSCCEVIYTKNKAVKELVWIKRKVDFGGRCRCKDGSSGHVRTIP